MSAASPLDHKRLEGVCAGLVVTLVCLLTFGIFIPRFGVYYDETVSIYILNRFDFMHLLEFVWGQARPMNAPIRWLLRDEVYGSHLAMLLVHTCNATLILFLLRYVLRGYLFPALLASILYCVYPLYWFRPAVVNLAIDGSLCFFLSSLALGVAAVYFDGWSRRLSYALGMIFLIFYVFLYELPFPLEIFRPLFFWRAAATETKDNHERLKLTFWRSLPWLIAAGSLGIYRLFVFKNSGFYKAINYNVPGFDTKPGQLGARAEVIWDQLATTWSYHVPQIFQSDAALGAMVAVSVVLFCFLHLWLFRRRLNADAAANQTMSKSLAFAAAGLAIMVLGQVAVAAARQLPEIDGLASRWNLVAAAGAGMIFVSIATTICNAVFPKRAMLALALLLSPMIGAGTILQVQNDQQFIHDWTAQRNFWWQLATKAPDLDDGTTVIVDHPYRAARDRPILIYEMLTMGSLFYDNPTISVINATEAIPGSWAFDNGKWNISWSYGFDRAILVHMSEGCLTIIEPKAPLPKGVVLSPSAARILPMLPENPAKFIKYDSDRTFQARTTYFSPKPAPAECPRDVHEQGGGARK
jgi:hypothetical protein